ncbi:MAG: lipopolysaccharide heptosyltransferase II [Candidatus Omnitrophota bacterium]
MEDIKKILFITLSNIGDVVLTLPALDHLRQKFPSAKVSVMCGQRAREIFEGAPFIEETVIFDKHAALKEKIRLFKALKAKKFDAVIDLRNSLFGLGLPAKYKVPVLRKLPAGLAHMKDKHLYKVAGKQAADSLRHSLYISAADEDCVGRILKDSHIAVDDRLIVIAPGSRSHTKKWAKEKFVELINLLAGETGVKIVLAGDKADLDTADYIAAACGAKAINLCGKTNLRELACLLKRSTLLVTNDSAALHIAGYLDIPVVAVFGITNEVKYGPWSQRRAVVKRDIFCRPCEKAQCRFGTLKCMQLIKVEDVLRAAKELLFQHPAPNTKHLKPDFRRILVVRTDRIGDVLLSTPVFKALRQAYPSAYIAAMVSPYAKEIVEGNPYIDDVIIYDKDFKHRSWSRSMKFASRLRKKHFDLALILHPINRSHLIAFFAGIKRRIGFDRKLAFLLTDKIKHVKQEGDRHELEYTLDLVRYLGIEPQDKQPFMPLKPDSEKWADELFSRESLTAQDRLLAINPAASCPSKIWPAERFAETADKLADKYGFKVLIFSGPKDTKLAETVLGHMQHRVINLAGKTSVSQLASALKRCSLFISNDSGPVHIAAAVGVPVISIFGRNQKGLSPKRWGPVGPLDIILHRQAGCIECLAHNCLKDFACLKLIKVDDVVKAADTILEARRDHG